MVVLIFILFSLSCLFLFAFTSCSGLCVSEWLCVFVCQYLCAKFCCSTLFRTPFKTTTTNQTTHWRTVLLSLQNKFTFSLTRATAIEVTIFFFPCCYCCCFSFFGGQQRATLFQCCLCFELIYGFYLTRAQQSSELAISNQPKQKEKYIRTRRVSVSNFCLLSVVLIKINTQTHTHTHRKRVNEERGIKKETETKKSRIKESESEWNKRRIENKQPNINAQLID